MPQGVNGFSIVIILRGSSVSESTVYRCGAYVISGSDSHGIGTWGPFVAHRSLISDEWDRVMSNRIDSLTDASSRNANLVTITELYVNWTESCTAGLSGYSRGPAIAVPRDKLAKRALFVSRAAKLSQYFMPF